MSKLLKKILVSMLAYVSMVFADTYESAITNSSDFVPSQSSHWVEPIDSSYLPFNICQDMTDIKIVKIREKVKYYWKGKKETKSLIHHYHNLVSVVEVTYQGKCLNKLFYEGVEFLFSENHDLDEAFASASERNEFTSHKHEYVDKPLDYIDENGVYRDKVYPEFSTYTKFDQNLIAQKWINKQVDYPDWKYVSGPSRLSRPVIFIHGLNDDYKTWGVEPVVEKGKDGINKGDVRFQKGLVKAYDRGSAPDILARSLNINNSEDSINHNGIYFFQAPGSIVDDKWRDANPHWNGIDGEDSQSSKLYQCLKEVLDDFYKDPNLPWSEHPELIVDIVAHSQGGLVVREMLRGLRAENASAGPENPANHIGRLVTVDTPHLGAATASKDSKDIPSHPGLGVLIDDLNAYYSGHAVRHTLMNLKLRVDYLNPLIPIFSGVTAGAVGAVGSVGAVLGVLGVNFPVIWGDPVVGPVATTAGGTAIVVGGTGSATGVATAGAAAGTVAPFISIAALSEYKVNVSGPYLGPYKISFNVDLPGPNEVFWSTELDAAADYRDMAIENRTLGDYLYKDDKFMKDLNYGKMENPTQDSRTENG